MKAQATGDYTLNQCVRCYHSLQHQDTHYLQNLPMFICYLYLNYKERILISTKNLKQIESHVVRHSDRYKAGLIIVQVLMRSVKTHGGLTRGRGMTEIQRLVLALFMPAWKNVNEAMQKLTGVSYQTSEQHICKDISTARQARDVRDTHACAN